MDRSASPHGDGVTELASLQEVDSSVAAPPPARLDILWTGSMQHPIGPQSALTSIHRLGLQHRQHAPSVSTLHLLEDPSIRRDAIGSARDVDIRIEWLRGRGSTTRPPTDPVRVWAWQDSVKTASGATQRSRFPPDLPGKYDGVVDIHQAAHF